MSNGLVIAGAAAVALLFLSQKKTEAPKSGTPTTVLPDEPPVVTAPTYGDQNYVGNAPPPESNPFTGVTPDPVSPPATAPPTTTSGGWTIFKQSTPIASISITPDVLAGVEYPPNRDAFTGGGRCYVGNPMSSYDPTVPYTDQIPNADWWDDNYYTCSNTGPGARYRWSDGWEIARPKEAFQQFWDDEVPKMPKTTCYGPISVYGRINYGEMSEPECAFAVYNRTIASGWDWNTTQLSWGPQVDASYVKTSVVTGEQYDQYSGAADMYHKWVNMKQKGGHPAGFKPIVGGILRKV